MALKYLILLSIACIAFGYPGMELETLDELDTDDGVEAMKATLVSASNKLLQRTLLLFIRKLNSDINLRNITSNNININTDDGVEAMKATLASISNNAEHVNAEGKCYYLCPNYVWPSLNWCCSQSVPVCAGHGYCCPYFHPNFYNGRCY